MPTSKNDDSAECSTKLIENQIKQTLAYIRDDNTECIPIQIIPKSKTPQDALDYLRSVNQTMIPLSAQA